MGAVDASQAALVNTQLALGVSTNWTNNNAWTGNRYPNNGSPTASTTYATTIASNGTYTVTLNTNISVNSLLLNAKGATLTQSYDNFNSLATNISAGVYNLGTNAQLSGGTLTVGGSGQFNVNSGTLAGMNLSNGTTINTTGVTFKNLLLSAGQATINVSSGAYFTQSQTLSGLTFNLTSPIYYNLSLSTPAGTQLTLASSTTIEGRGTISPTALINQGMIQANGQSGLYVSPSTLSSSGTMSAVNNSTLDIEASNWNNSGAITTDGTSEVILNGNWSNTGTITGSPGGAIYLGGSFTTAGLGNFNVNGANLTFADNSFDNSNNNLSFPGAGSLTIGGTVTNGSITPPTGQPLYLGGELDNVQVNGDLNVNGASYYQSTLGPGTVVTTGNITVNSSTLNFSGTQTLDHANVILNGLSTINGGTSLTLGSQTTVTVASTYGGSYYYGAAFGGSSITNNGSIILPSATEEGGYNVLDIFSSSFINQATITVGAGDGLYIEAGTSSNAGTISVGAGGTFYISSGNWTNTGTIAVGAGSSVTLYGNFSTSDLAGISAAGDTTTISGTMNNSNSTFTVDGTLGSVTLLGQINGGNVKVTNSQMLQLNGSSFGPIHGIQSAAVTVDPNATISVNTYVAIIEGPALVNNGTISEVYENLYLSSDSVTNNGTINITNNSYAYLDGSTSLTNAGQLIANSASVSITVPTWTNTGTMSAINGGTITIGSNSFANAGTINVDGTSSFTLSNRWTNTGTINLTPGASLSLGGSFTTSALAGIDFNGAGFNVAGTLDNSNSTLNLTSAIGSVTVNGSITGGTIDVRSGQKLAVNSSGSVAAAVTVDAGATLYDGGTITGPSFVNHGMLTISYATINSDTFANDGTINVNGLLSRNNVLDVGQGTLTGLGSISCTTLIFDNDPSTYDVGFDGIEPDQLSVTGGVILGGNLMIDLPAFFELSLDPSDSFDVLTVDSSDTLIGSFLNVASGGRLETADGSGSFEVDYGGTGAYQNEIVISDYQAGQVPEPTAMLLTAMALPTLLGRGRRRHITAR
jgi:hypothetical protein